MIRESVASLPGRVCMFWDELRFFPCMIVCVSVHVFTLSCVMPFPSKVHVWHH